MLADRALASENDVDESKPGVAEIKVSETGKLVGLLEDLSRPTTKGETVKHGITHKIVTKGHPVFVRPRRLAPDKLVTAKREFDDMIKLGVIEPATVNGPQRFI